MQSMMLGKGGVIRKSNLSSLKNYGDRYVIKDVMRDFVTGESENSNEDIKSKALPRLQYLSKSTVHIYA